MFWLFFLHLLSFSALRHCQHAITAFPLEDDSDRPGDSKIDKESNGWIIFSCMLAVLRVLLNLTHENGRLRPTLFFLFFFFGCYYYYYHHHQLHLIFIIYYLLIMHVLVYLDLYDFTRIKILLLKLKV